MGTCELFQKGLPGPRWAKTSFFFYVFKVFKNEENDHILTPGQLKYTISLIWMKNVWIEPKRSVVGENFNFFDFFKSFQKWIKNDVNWAKKVPQVCVEWKLQYFRFFEKFSEIKKMIIFSLQDN